MSETDKQPVDETATRRPEPTRPAAPDPVPAKEIGGRKNGTDPTRYGDWEKNGRCIDF